MLLCSQSELRSHVCCYNRSFEACFQRCIHVRCHIMFMLHSHLELLLYLFSFSAHSQRSLHTYAVKFTTRAASIRLLAYHVCSTHSQSCVHTSIVTTGSFQANFKSCVHVTFHNMCHAPFTTRAAVIPIVCSAYTQSCVNTSTATTGFIPHSPEPLSMSAVTSS